MKRYIIIQKDNVDSEPDELMYVVDVVNDDPDFPVSATLGEARLEAMVFSHGEAEFYAKELRDSYPGNEYIVVEHKFSNVFLPKVSSMLCLDEKEYIMPEYHNVLDLISSAAKEKKNYIELDKSTIPDDTIDMLADMGFICFDRDVLAVHW